MSCIICSLIILFLNQKLAILLHFSPLSLSNSAILAVTALSDFSDYVSVKYWRTLFCLWFLLLHVPLFYYIPTFYTRLTSTESPILLMNLVQIHTWFCHSFTVTVKTVSSHFTSPHPLSCLDGNFQNTSTL